MVRQIDSWIDIPAEPENMQIRPDRDGHVTDSSHARRAPSQQLHSRSYIAVLVLLLEVQVDASLSPLHARSYDSSIISMPHSFTSSSAPIICVGAMTTPERRQLRETTRRDSVRTGTTSCTPCATLPSSKRIPLLSHMPTFSSVAPDRVHFDRL
jgi:hypothetical protein